MPACSPLATERGSWNPAHSWPTKGQSGSGFSVLAPYNVTRSFRFPACISPHPMDNVGREQQLHTHGQICSNRADYNSLTMFVKMPYDQQRSSSHIGRQFGIANICPHLYRGPLGLAFRPFGDRVKLWVNPSRIQGKLSCRHDLLNPLRVQEHQLINSANRRPLQLNSSTA